MKIYVDAGHGGLDAGAIGNGLQEKDVTLAIATRIQRMLREEYRKVAVKMSRTKDQTVSLEARTKEANAWGADFFLSIHVNAGGGTGYEDYIHQQLPGTSRTSTIRNTMHTEIVKLSKLKNRGKKKANFHVLRESSMPAVLTENGFIDAKADAEKMKSNTWLDQMARGHVNGLAKALNLKGAIGVETFTSQKYIEVRAETLWTYNTINWKDRAKVVRKGEVFTMIRDRFSVGNGAMYQLKSGLFITANPTHVRVFTK